MNATLRQLVADTFESACIDKSLYSGSGLNEQSIPVFVGEWLIDRQLKGGEWTDEVRQKVIDFVRKYIPTKDEVEDLKQRLRSGDLVLVLEYVSPRVNLERDQAALESGSLGNQKVQVEGYLLEKYPRLLKGGMWGLASYQYRRSEKKGGGEVWLTDFKPLQANHIDVDAYVAKRRLFDREQWTQLLINSLGYNAEGSGYTTTKTRLALLTRLIPFVQRRVNLFELAPKGTGKSFLFGQFSRYSRLIEGGAVSPAVLFYHETTGVPGLFTQFDLVVFDEAQTLSFSNPDVTVAKLKGYLEQGKYSKGKFTVSADAGAVFLANVPIGANGRPANERKLFGDMPALLQETALLDRIHGLLPGWHLPRMSVDTLSKGIGLKADYLGEIFHALRFRLEYDEFVEQRQHLIGSRDFRDVRAILRLSSGLLKLLFPDLTTVTEQEFADFCLKPAIALRQALRDQLHYLDPEFPGYEITLLENSGAAMEHPVVSVEDAPSEEAQENQ